MLVSLLHKATEYLALNMFTLYTNTEAHQKLPEYPLTLLTSSVSIGVLTPSHPTELTRGCWRGCQRLAGKNMIIWLCDADIYSLVLMKT